MVVVPGIPASKTVILFKMMQDDLPFKLNLIDYRVYSKPFVPFCTGIVPLSHAIKRIVPKSCRF